MQHPYLNILARAVLRNHAIVPVSDIDRDAEWLIDDYIKANSLTDEQVAQIEADIKKADKRPLVKFEDLKKAMSYRESIKQYYLN